MAASRQGALSFPFPDSSIHRPSSAFTRLRAEEPVARVALADGSAAWLVSGYEETRTVMTDPRFSRTAATEPGAPGRDLFIRIEWPSILAMDPPEHTRLRGLVGRAFTARRVERLRPRVQEVVDRLLDDLVADGPPADLVARFALPLPVTVICELLGVPPADQALFHARSDARITVGDAARDLPGDADQKLKDYLTGLVAERRRDPRDDLLSGLIAARDESDRLSEDELVRMGITLLVAGHETTANHIGNSTVVLMRHPDQARRLLRDPELVPGAVEELLRYVQLESTSAAHLRVATEDVRLGGATIRAGDAVIPAIRAANRDDAVFPDPDRLDVARSGNPHIAFGSGPHHCLGAGLARMELQVALGTLLRRLPTLRLAVPESELNWKSGVLFHSLIDLPVTW